MGEDSAFYGKHRPSIKRTFISELESFLIQHPDWKDHARVHYHGMGEYRIDFSIDINGDIKGKEANHRIGDMINVMRGAKKP